jgi:hypothetical protein
MKLDFCVSHNYTQRDLLLLLLLLLEYYTTYPKTTNFICNYENKRGR